MVGMGGIPVPSPPERSGSGTREDGRFLFRTSLATLVRGTRVRYGCASPGNLEQKRMPIERTDGIASHRGDGGSISSREGGGIERTSFVGPRFV